ncbi:PhoU domain-containing protein, partial [Escherichia coli]
MGEFATEMVHRSVEAMLNKDIELAKEVMKKDLV